MLSVKDRGGVLVRQRVTGVQVWRALLSAALQPYTPLTNAGSCWRWRLCRTRDADVQRWAQDKGSVRVRALLMTVAYENMYTPGTAFCCGNCSV